MEMQFNITKMEMFSKVSIVMMKKLEYGSRQIKKEIYKVKDTRIINLMEYQPIIRQLD